MARRRPRPTPPTSATLADLPDKLLTWRGTDTRAGDDYRAAHTGWLAERTAWLAEHGLTVTDRELRTEHRRRTKAHLTDHPDDRFHPPRPARRDTHQ